MTEKHNPYKAQIKYSELLYEFLKIPKWLRPIKSWRAFKKAEDFRNSHRKCCEWANEED